MILACDCDGTLSSSGGPVQISRLQELVEIGIKVCIVSPSGNCASLPFPRFVDWDRVTNLRKVREAYPEESLFIYVSDNQGDDETARQAGFTYVHPKDLR